MPGVITLVQALLICILSFQCLRPTLGGGRRPSLQRGHQRIKTEGEWKEAFLSRASQMVTDTSFSVQGFPDGK